MHGSADPRRPPSPAPRCAQCGSSLRLLPVMYGYPSREGAAAADRGEIALGGCVPKAISEVCSVCLVHPHLINTERPSLIRSWEAAPRPPSITPRQRLAGAVWGHLIGDALGVPYKSMAATDIHAFELRGGGYHGQLPGTWSDDGALMLALLDSVTAGNSFDPEDQGQRFLRRSDAGAYTPDGDGRFDIGSATAKAMDNLRAGIPATDAGRTGPDDAGNGSLMRILPIALFSNPNHDVVLVQRAHLASRVTQADPRCQVACALYVLVGRRLLWCASAPSEVLEESITTLQEIYRHRPIWIDDTHAPALEQLLERRGSVRYGSGYVLDTFWGAWEAFAAAKDYGGTVEAAIRYGGDTDTTAAIAGGLAGLHWGVEGIPHEWLVALRGQDIVEPMLQWLVTSGWHTSLD